jgi:hypothetical protein
MGGSVGMKRVCETYIRHSCLIGALWCVIPTLAWFIAALSMVPFREVYLLRLAISLIVGGTLAAFSNRYGVSIWLMKHSSQKGPATVLDGLVIGCSVGMGTALVPPLTLLIATNHLEEAKTYIIVCYLAAMGIGALIGAVLAAIGRKYLDLASPRKEE